MSKKPRLGYIKAGRSLEIIIYWAIRSEEIIRVISGYFTVKGYSTVKKYFEGKKLVLIVGIEEPAEAGARKVLIDEILRELRTGSDIERYQTVQELVAKIQRGGFHLIDARALDHHAKVYIFDNKAALVSSSNFTFKGLHDREESGLPTVDSIEVQGFIDDFEKLYARAFDITQELLGRFEKWLELTTPWEVYLKTLFCLEGYEEIPAANSLYRFPVSYQKYLVARAVNSLREHGGHMIVAQTGLGKTVIGTEVARILHMAHDISHALVIGPSPVQEEWESHMLTAGIPCRYLVYQNLNFTDPDQSGPLANFIYIVEKLMNEGWLIIVDESHFFRNRYRQVYLNGQLTTLEKLAYKRLAEARQQTGAKILLLTGTPYSKSKNDINFQLALLPHSSQSLVLSEFTNMLNTALKPKPWRVSRPEELKELDEVATVLTTPVVVRNWAQRDDENGYPYLVFGEEKRYFPRINLSRVDAEVFLPEAILPVLASDILRLKGDYTYDPETHQVNNAHIIWSQRAGATKAWASSPWALASRFSTAISPEEHPKGYLYSLEERILVLNQVIEAIETLTFGDDPKLQALLVLLDSLIQQGRKVIVFCLYQATVAYLERAIENFRPDWNVFSTVYSSAQEFGGKPTSLVKKAINRFAPISNGINPSRIKDPIDVFLSTDRFGVGVNMQDADVIINYDLPWDAIAPNQRAGRILRPWKEPRVVEISILVPILPANVPDSGEFKLLERHWRKLVERHDKSATLLDIPVITTEKNHNVDMFGLGRIIELGEIGYDALSASDIETSAILSKHMALLEHHRSEAEVISDDIVSAMTSGDPRVKNMLVVLLLKRFGTYHIAVYDVVKQQLLSMSDAKILDLMECNQKTPLALVDREQIEEYSDEGLVAWCKHRKFDPDHVVRICTLALKPLHADDSFETYLT